VPDPLAARDEETAALEYALETARRYLEELNEAPVLPAQGQRFGGALPEDGDGALAALTELVAGSDIATRSSGPRFFHFVTGGTTPAALGADWLTSLFDQNAFSAASSPYGTELEGVAVGWLLDLFELPRDWSGVLTSGATMANFVGLASARRWWAERHDVDIDEHGFAGLPAVPVSPASTSMPAPERPWRCSGWAGTRCRSSTPTRSSPHFEAWAARRRS
jgi:hypothetical protein